MSDDPLDQIAAQDPTGELKRALDYYRKHRERQRRFRAKVREEALARGELKQRRPKWWPEGKK